MFIIIAATIGSRKPELIAEQQELTTVTVIHQQKPCLSVPLNSGADLEPPELRALKDGKYLDKQIFKKHIHESMCLIVNT